MNHIVVGVTDCCGQRVYPLATKGVYGIYPTCHYKPGQDGFCDPNWVPIDPSKERQPMDFCGVCHSKVTFNRSGFVIYPVCPNGCHEHSNFHLSAEPPVTA